MEQVEIVEASQAGLIGEARALFSEYWTSFGFTPCFQDFGEELAGLPGRYAPPDGRLLIALVDGAPAGCVALRRLDASRAEGKRLWVRPAFRRHGIGRALLERLRLEAIAAGYREIAGDTLPVMGEALGLYERLGFERQEGIAGEGNPHPIQLRWPL
jgi:putative acetyltransferase